MTIFRSNPLLAVIAKVLALSGLWGFLACVGYQIVVGRQLFDDEVYRTPALGRTIPVDLKGSRFFLDQRTAQRVNFAENAALPAFLVGIIAVLYLKRVERREKSE